MNIDPATPRPTPITGYAEGYYGRLLSWLERESLIECAAATGFNFYLYAPKDDEQHRFKWRDPYPEQWRRNFQNFADVARDCGVQLVAGISPGIDFNFDDIEDGPDLHALCTKAIQLLDDGASGIAVLFDDIDPDFYSRRGSFESEGAAHASVANRLQQQLNRHKADTGQYNVPVYSVPRIYANELIAGGDPLLVSGLKDRNSTYLKDFCKHLAKDIAWFYCGREIVARAPSENDLQGLTDKPAQKIIIWDNFYANDYCPRRFFAGPWSGRQSCTDIVINPTGMCHTDALLMRIVASSRNADLNSADLNNGDSNDNYELWRQCIKEAGVPDAFHDIAHHFSAPVFSDQHKANSSANAENQHKKPTASVQLAALEQLLWQWKSPLAREWYPYLMGLKHDLSIADGKLSELRIRKTQNSPLAKLLT